MTSQVKNSPQADLSVSASASPRSVLLVDNFEPWRRLVCSRLEANEQLRVVGEAADGLEAVQKAHKLKPDLVLLDISLPNLNGFETARRITQLVPEAKILFVTQTNDADVVKAALSNGARGYLLKADAGSELLPAIETVLRGEKFVSADLLNRVLD